MRSDSDRTAADPPGARTFAQIYGAHARYVAHVVSRLGVGHDSVDDAVQDVFVVAYQRLHTCEGRGSPHATRAWLGGIARRIASRHRRTRARKDRRQRALSLVYTESVDLEPELHRRDAARRLARFVETLTPEQCRLFVMSELEGRSGPEIAAGLGLNLNTVYARIRTLRLRWCAWLEREGEPNDQRAPAWLLGLAGLLRKAVALPRAAWRTWQPLAAASVLSLGLGFGAPAPARSLPPVASQARSLVSPPARTGVSMGIATRIAVGPPQAQRPIRRRLREEPRSSPPPPVSTTSSLQRELALIERARLQWADAPRRARAALQDHARAFPDGALARERRTLQVRVHCRLGEVAQARALAGDPRACAGIPTDSRAAGDSNER